MGGERIGGGRDSDVEQARERGEDDGAVDPRPSPQMAAMRAMHRRIQIARAYNAAHPDQVEDFNRLTRGVASKGVRAIMSWQREHGVDADGKVGPATLNAAATADAKQQPRGADSDADGVVPAKNSDTAKKPASVAEASKQKEVGDIQNAEGDASKVDVTDPDANADKSSREGKRHEFHLPHPELRGEGQPPANGKLEPPQMSAWPRQDHDEQYYAAIAQQESGDRFEGDFSAGTRNAAGATGSYGRYQTTAAAAVDVLQHNESARETFGMSKQQVEHAEHAIGAMDRFWQAVIDGKPTSFTAQETGTGAVHITAADIALVHSGGLAGIGAFVAKFGAVFQTVTSAAPDKLRRMCLGVELKKIINAHKAAARVGSPAQQKAARQQIAHTIFAANPWIGTDLGMQPVDLTGFLREDMFAENKVGFEMAAATGAEPDLETKVLDGPDHGEIIGRMEMEREREHLEALAQKLGFDLSTLEDEHVYGLCAYAHHSGVGKIVRSDFVSLQSLIARDRSGYVRSVIDHFRRNAGR